MKYELEGVCYHIEILNEKKDQTLVFLHGFTGSTKTWHEVAEHLSRYRIVLVDLIGHGKSGSPEDAGKYTMEKQIQNLEELFEQLELTHFSLIGYSMGGRTALSYACTYPERLESLILESVSPGLRFEKERQERRERDAQLAERIMADGIVSFVDRWENIPLFDSQKSLPDVVKKQVRNERLKQDPAGLANSLIGMGTGSQASYWENLNGLDMPVLLVTGRLDLKFTAIAEEMKEMLPDARWKTIDAGHAIHVEKPAEFATIVDEYLSFNNRGGKS